ncbi:MAG: sensor histidine kinase [Bacteroidia bacterium]
MMDNKKQIKTEITDIIDSSTDIILSIDADYNVVFFNKVLYKMVKTGYGVELTKGKLFPVLEIIDPKKYKAIKRIYERIFSTGKNMTKVEMFTTLKGKNIYFESNYNPIKQNNKVVGITIFSRDITKRIESEKKLHAVIKEKEVLLKEVHHRVKNNLQVISSIINLQKNYTNDKETANLLKECQDRIKTMAYIHESLYQTKDLLHINFGEYIINLVKNLFASYDATQQKIKAIFDVDNIFLSLDTSIPCGLIVNELVSNALKYAFTDGLGGVITLKIKKIKNNKTQLIVADNGIGIPSTINYKNTESLGLQLVTILAQQINGVITLNRTSEQSKHIGGKKNNKKQIKGTIFELTF